MNTLGSETVAFLKGYARSLSEGDVPGIVGAWHTPALLLAESGPLPLVEPHDLDRLFRTARADAAGRGVDGVTLEVAEVASHSRGLITAEVTWSYRDAGGRPVGEERALCVLSRAPGSDTLGFDLYAHIDARAG